MVKPSRLKSIAAYIDKGGQFPTNIVINFKTKKSNLEFQKMENFENTAFGKLTLPGQYGSAWVIDGQHRLYGFPPGGSGDFIARNMGEEMSRLLDQQIIVNNRPGAGANIASEIIVRATPDGYTILLGGSFSHAVNPALYRKLPFDVEKDFAPITKVANFTTIIAVNPKLQVKSAGCSK